MQAYLNLIKDVLEHGEDRADRTGVGTRSLFGTQTRYDLREGFPLVTTKKVLFPAVVHELLWFLRGETNIHDGLAEHTPIWNAWADENGELGPIYGFQWRHWGCELHSKRRLTTSDCGYWEGVDQITKAICLVQTDPDSRRNIVSAWNVECLHWMKLPPCHVMFQLYVSGEYLDMQMYQRSADLALGVPFNIASYALLLSMISQETRKTPRFFVHTIGDAHVYLNHMDGISEQLSRKPLPLPTLELADKPVLEMAYEDIKLVGYQHHGFIKYPVAV